MGEKWTAEEMKALIDKVLADNTATKKKFSLVKTASELNWDYLKIDTKSNESCEQAFKKMTSWVLKHQTVRDVAALVKTELEKSKIPLSMVPDAPKKPMTAFFLFCQDKYGSLKKKHPGISVIEANRLSQEKWAALSPVKKEKYQRIYKTHKTEYDLMQATFTTKKDTVEKKKKGRANLDILTPFDLYYESTPSEGTKQAAKQVYEAFDDNRKMHWIWSAIRECNKAKEESELGDVAENGAAPLVTPHLKETEKRILLRSEGIHDKPPRTLLAFYRYKHKDSVDPDKVDTLNEKYRNLDDDDILNESLEYLNWMKAYTKRVDAYLSKFISMKTDDREDIKYHNKAYQKLILKMEVSVDKQKRKKTAPVKVQAEKKTEVPETKKAKAATPKATRAATPIKKETGEAMKRARQESLSSDSSSSDDEEVANKSKSKSKASKSPAAKKSKSADEEIDEKTPVKTPSKDKKRKKSLLSTTSSAEEQKAVDSDISFKVASASKSKKSRKSSRTSE